MLTEQQITKSKAVKCSYVGSVTFYDGKFSFTVFTRKGVKHARKILRENPEKVLIKECANPPYYIKGINW